MMTLAEVLTVCIAAAGLLGGLVMYAIRSNIAPIRVVIENNTQALTRLMEKLDDHETVLDDHGTRITKIETVHKLRHGDE